MTNYELPTANDKLPISHLSLVSRPSFSSAFTLVELLTVVVIISILATLSTVALTESMQTAREIKTQGTIQKIDVAIQDIFESYGDRFENILGESNYVSGLTDVNKQKLKLHLIRDAMRMEMPQSWAEVFNSSDTATPKAQLGPISVTLQSNNYQLSHPSPVLKFYYNQYQQFVNRGGNPAIGPSRASLLFMIIANLNPEALESFGANELRDTDGDGIPEFIDAWGKPIYFLRWAPAFPGSDRQPDIFYLSNSANTQFTISPLTPEIDTLYPWIKGPWGAGPNDPDNTIVSSCPTNSNLRYGFTRANTRSGDPFDDDDTVGPVQNGWFLYPLVYSGGRDGLPCLYSEFTVNDEPKSPQVYTPPGILDPFFVPYGYPIVTGSSGGKLKHYDNIHNHRPSSGF